MSGLPGYDSWKLASPPEYGQRDTCPDCGEQFAESFSCSECGWNPDKTEAAYDRYIDQQIDEAREREWERGVGR